MSKRMVLLATVAFISAVGTTMMVRGWVAAERAAVASAPQIEVAPPPPMAEVLVASDALPAGMVLKPQHLKWQTWPTQSVAEGYHVKAKGDMQLVVGSVVRNGIGKGEPILENRIVRPGDRGFLAAILTPGMRAVSVPINATSGISGLIFPGDRVDVILTHTINPDSAQGDRVKRASETVLQNIRVLATDQRTDHEDGSGGAVAKTATVEVTSKEAEILSMVTELGRLSLSLRSLEIVGDPTAVQAEDSGTDNQATKVVASAEVERGKPEKQSYTLDSQVSVLLGSAKAKASGKSGRQVDIVRGKDVQQLNF